MTVTVALFIKYENEKKSDMIHTPNDRAEVSRKAVAAMGGSSCMPTAPAVSTT